MSELIKSDMTPTEQVKFLWPDAQLTDTQQKIINQFDNAVAQLPSMEWTIDPGPKTFKMIGAIGHILMTRTIGEIETTSFKELSAQADYEMTNPNAVVSEGEK